MEMNVTSGEQLDVHSTTSAVTSMFPPIKELTYKKWEQNMATIYEKDCFELKKHF